MAQPQPGEQFPIFPIGTPGQPWGEAERKQWLMTLVKQRDYFGEIVSRAMRYTSLDLFQYGEVDYRDREIKTGKLAKYPLFAGRSKNWDEKKPLIVVTSGNHGYEVTEPGLFLFLDKFYTQEFEGKANYLFLFCMCPFGYEVDHRWTPNAVDPNRSFHAKGDTDEGQLAMKCVFEHEKKSAGMLAHFDLHETTDTDNLIFTPTKIARDGAANREMDEIPQGWYSVENSDGGASQPEFQKAIIEEVRKVTKIAAADHKGEIIGEKIASEGVIVIPGRKWNICGAFSRAPYNITTEVYPDAPGCTREECDAAQAACIAAGCRYALAHPLPPLAESNFKLGVEIKDDLKA